MTDPKEIVIPQLTLSIPEPLIGWAYTAYTSLLLSTIEAELEGIPDEIDNLWTALAKLDSIWSAGFDLVAAIGYNNVLVSEKAKELAYGKQLYASMRGIFSEAIRAKNLQLYLSTRLDIEKQKQLRFVDEQQIQMDFAKGIIETSVSAYNTAVRIYDANISAIELERQRWDAIVSANDKELKLLELAYSEAQLESELVRGVIRQQLAVAGIEAATARAQQILMDIELNEAQVIAAGAEVQRLGIQALLVGTQQIEVQAQTLATQVDTQVIQAEGAQIAVLEAANAQINEQIQNIAQISAARDKMYADTIAEKTLLVSRLETAQTALIAANTAYATVQGALAQARISAETTKLTTDDTVEDARTVATWSVDDAQFDSANLVMDARTRAELLIEAARVKADGLTTGAKIVTETEITGAKFSADSAVVAAKIGADITTEEAKYIAEVVQGAARIKADTIINAGQVEAQSISASYKYQADGIMNTSKLTSESIVYSGRDKANAIQNEGKFEADNILNSGKLDAEMITITGKQQAEFTLDGAKLETELTTMSADSLHNSTLISMESANRIAMEAVKLSGDLSNMIIANNLSQNTRNAAYALDLQKLVSGWAIQNSHDKVEEARRDATTDIQLQQLRATGKRAAARAAAASALKDAKVTNTFTEVKG